MRRQADEKHYPASITKVLSVLVALENSELTDEVDVLGRQRCIYGAGGCEYRHDARRSTQYGGRSVCDAPGLGK